jgi:cell division protein FtsI/penicillin-binding protein 2
MKKITPARGDIFDRNKEPLAMNITNYKLFVEPKKVSEPEKVIMNLDNILHLGTATLEALIKSDKDWMRIQDGLSKDLKDKIMGLKMSGIGFEDSPSRYYPEGSIASHLIGFVGKSFNGEDVGNGGIENYYQKDLAGMPGIYKTERDTTGNAIFSGVQVKIDPEDGRNLVLTIDKTVQMVAKDRLKKGLEKYQADSGCILIANPSNMEILAMTCLPDYDPMNYGEFNDSFFNNPAITSAYEPGSIFKPLVMAAALQEKALKVSDVMDEDGPVTIGEYTIRNWNNQYDGKISMSKILEKSSNIGMTYVGSKLGKEKLLSYLDKYGFGKPTNIDLTGEGSGLLKSDDAWYPIDLATASFGQGILVTPIQMITAFSSLVNGGELLEPHVVKQFEDSGKTIEVKKKKIAQVIDKNTSDSIKKMMENVVENGEVKWAKPKGYRIGGKTGTAQIVMSGKYDAAKTYASFIGFAPVNDPKFVVLVSLQAPKTSTWGSETAAPLFFEVAKELLFYYNISPN